MFNTFEISWASTRLPGADSSLDARPVPGLTFLTVGDQTTNSTTVADPEPEPAPETVVFDLLEDLKSKREILEECTSKIPGVDIYISASKVFLMSSKSKTIEPRTILGGCLANIVVQGGASPGNIQEQAPLCLWPALGAKGAYPLLAHLSSGLMREINSELDPHRPRVRLVSSRRLAMHICLSFVCKSCSRQRDVGRGICANGPAVTT